MHRTLVLFVRYSALINFILMIQKSKYFFLLILLFNSKANSQKAIERTVCCCSRVIEQLSNGWKNDSLANNDYRISNTKLLLNCKYDSIRINFLIEKFGKPTELRKTNHGSEYVYYYYDFRTKPKGFDGPLAAAYIAFYFDLANKFYAIVEGDIDL